MGPWSRLALALPFILIWLVPAVYWVGERKKNTRFDELLHFASYLSMGWLNFAFFLAIARDIGVLVAISVPALGHVYDFLAGHEGAELVLAGSLLALAAGAAAALRGPRVRRVDIPIEGLHPALEGLRIVQITDLHVGPTIGARYVRRVVQMANALDADLVALTGDFVDGPVARLANDVAALAELKPAERRFFVLGNHEYYAGAQNWIDHFRAMGIRVLLNESSEIQVGDARVLIGGVLDPAGGPQQPPRADLAAGDSPDAAFRLLLAHNPKLAPLGAQAGFDLQLSGHTHAGQFFPWTLAVKLVHTKHVWGLSREGRMWVYVSAGTGSWGPPVRFGSEPELTLIRLVQAGKERPARRPA
jgi:predicted MPP superfamily phosphohydrolase